MGKRGALHFVSKNCLFCYLSREARCSTFYKQNFIVFRRGTRLSPAGETAFLTKKKQKSETRRSTFHKQNFTVIRSPRGQPLFLTKGKRVFASENSWKRFALRGGSSSLRSVPKGMPHPSSASFEGRRGDDRFYSALVTFAQTRL